MLGFVLMHMATAGKTEIYIWLLRRSVDQKRVLYKEDKRAKASFHAASFQYDTERMNGPKQSVGVDLETIAT